MSRDILANILLNLSSFPSLPTAGIKILKILDNHRAPVEDVLDILRYEPGLTANILKLANSPFFGLPQKVGSLKQAIMLLGLKRVVKLVLAASMNALMNREMQGYNLPSGILWRHSVTVAFAAEAFAERLKVSVQVEVFTPALLHDLGKLALNNFVKKQFDDINKIASKGVPFELAENMVLGIDHAEIGAQILRQWSFPLEVVDAVRFHHNPERLQIGSSSVDILYLSNFLCHSKEEEKVDDRPLDETARRAMRRLGISREEFSDLATMTRAIIRDLPSSIPFN